MIHGIRRDQRLTKKFPLNSAEVNSEIGSYALSDLLSMTKDEDITDLYDKSKKDPQTEGVVFPFSLQPEMEKESLPLSDTLPDTTLADGSDALLVQFPYTRPANRHFTDFMGLPFVENATEIITVEIVSAPDNDLQVGLICKVATGTGWSILSDILLECWFIWR